LIVSYTVNLALTYAFRILSREPIPSNVTTHTNLRSKPQTSLCYVPSIFLLNSFQRQEAIFKEDVKQTAIWTAAKRKQQFSVYSTLTLLPALLAYEINKGLYVIQTASCIRYTLKFHTTIRITERKLCNVPQHTFSIYGLFNCLSTSQCTLPRDLRDDWRKNWRACGKVASCLIRSPVPAFI